MPSASDPRQQNRTRQPVPRPAQPGQRSAQPTQRSARPTQRAAQQLAARPARHAGGARFKRRLLPSARRGRPRNHAPTHIMLMARTALLRPRARAITRTPGRGAQKKSSPVPMIIGGVVAVLALGRDRFLCRAGRQGLFWR